MKRHWKNRKTLRSVLILSGGLMLVAGSGLLLQASGNNNHKFMGYPTTGEIELIHPRICTVAPSSTVQDTSRKAELIVYGEVIDVEYIPKLLLPQTVGTVRIDSCIKGDLPEGSLILVHKNSGYTTASAQKDMLADSLEGLDPSGNSNQPGKESKPENLQLSIIEGDWPLEKNSKHIFCLYKQNREDGEPVYNVVFGAESEWIEMSPDEFFEPVDVWRHVRSKGITSRLKQQPYSSNPPADDGEFTGGISLEEIKEKYSKQSEEF